MTHGEHEKAAENEHTPEPWKSIEEQFHGEVMNFIGDKDGGTIGEIYTENDARRIVACVNACAGMTNEQIDNVCMISGSLLNRFGEQMAYLGQVEKQRDDLLAALKWIDVFGFDAPELRARARMAIASVKEVS